ncbi:hypothetical protein [Cupriavidus sp.]|uniref:hypothetical protein n=1 Tax=Cupriavidus sp. TaxID=1873897 RepID=UPI003D15003B
MKLYLRPLCLVIVTARLIPARFDGYTVGPVVLVRPGTSAALLAHEQTHARQFWRWLGCNGLLYQVSRRWRLRLELEAYRAQLAVAGAPAALPLSADLASRYDLDITQEEAYRQLTA